VPRFAASAKRPVWKDASGNRLIPADAVATAKPAESVPPALQPVRAKVDTRGRGLWHAITSHARGKAPGIWTMGGSISQIKPRKWECLPKLMHEPIEAGGPEAASRLVG